jgi:hypothetical protein
MNPQNHPGDPGNPLLHRASMRAHTFLSWHYANTAFASQTLEIPFVPGITYLVGSCGSNKTNCAHLARKTVGAPPPKKAEQRADFDERVKAQLAGGTVTVRVQTAQGEPYASVFCAAAGGAPKTLGGDGQERAGVKLKGELFSCQFFGPLELGAIARSKEALLELFQRFEEAEIGRIEDRIAILDQELLLSGAEVRRLARQLANDEERAKELPQLEETLKGMQPKGGPDPAAVARANEAKNARGKQRLAMEKLVANTRKARASIGAAAKEAIALLGRSVDAPLESGTYGESFRRAHASAQRGAAAIEEAARRTHDALVTVERETEVEQAALAGFHAKDDAEYDAFVANRETSEQAAARARVQERYDELCALEKNAAETRATYEAKRRENRALFEERVELFAKMREIHVGIQNRANAGLKELVGKRVRVSVKHGRDTRGWLEALTLALEGSNAKTKLVAEIAKRVSPSELAEAVRANDLEPIMRVDPMGADGRRKRAERVVEHLREKANVDALELVRVPDVVKLKLTTSKGRVLSRKLSHGQANICVLLLLLLQSTGPIVIDEPELSLDEDYINDVLVPALRVVRKRCQIILISHHATLICLSEPDLVHKLADEDGEVLVVRSGALDEMRDVIERMDGGRDAFLLRAKLYGHRVGGV